VTDEDGLASPLDDDLPSISAAQLSGTDSTHVLALGDGGEIDLNLGLGQNVGRGGHIDEEVCRAVSLAGCSPSNCSRKSSAKQPIAVQYAPERPILLFNSPLKLRGAGCGRCK
jgi:hypothetical protein